MIDREALQSYGVKNVERVLPDNADLIRLAAVEILVSRFNFGVIGYEIEDEVISTWRDMNNVKVDSEMVKKIKETVKTLYLDDDFRHNVFFAINEASRNK